jgi:endonuclease YncB( thermonuclease family)
MKGLFRILFFGPGRLLIRWIDECKAANGVPPLGTFLRGSVHTFTWFVILMVASAAANPAPASSTRSVSSSSAAPTATRAPAALSTTPSTAVDRTGDRVGRVIDGDTFELADGRKVRVLGIDSCEDHSPKTPGGADATWAATMLLSGATVVLTAQPGAPDADQYDRLLRYVTLPSGADFGQEMVGYDHTGVYQGRNDASPEYVERLYAHDLDHAASPPSGRECGSYPPPVDEIDDHYVPVPDNDDGDDGESRFCRKRWWC